MANDGIEQPDLGAASRTGDPLNEQVYQKLRWALTVGGYRPGDKASIRSLARRLGISAMPVREALKRLVSERALEVLGNRAFRVPVLEPKRVSDLFFIRSSLEGVATELAAPNLGAAQIDRLAELAVQTDRDVDEGDTAGYLSRNYNFHFTIYAASGNSDLVSIIEGLWAQTGPFLAVVVRDQEMSRDWRKLHGQIADAIRARDAVAARRMIEKDISWGTIHFDRLAGDGEDAVAEPAAAPAQTSTRLPKGRTASARRSQKERA
jgi:DNA-binding GntR family transcriptional regulator